MEGIPETMAWCGYTVTLVKWGFIYTERGYFMYQHQPPIRKGNRLRLEYTFRDRITGLPLDLTDYSMVKLSVKTGGVETPVLVDAEFDTDKTLGVVFIEGYKLPAIGIVSAQFIAYDSEDPPNELAGDPALVEVVKNNADLTIDELPNK